MNRKFDGVPTGELFDVESYRETAEQKNKSIKSVAQGNCPYCLRGKVGLIRSNEHLAWRYHTVKTWGGATVECRAVGVWLCLAPEKEPLNPSEPIGCKHGKAKP